jgi:hypothetical protein
MNLTEEIILTRINCIKDALMKLKKSFKEIDPDENSNRVKFDLVNTSKIINFENYPVDYKCFLERIGTLVVGMSTAFMFEVTLPSNPEDYIDDFEFNNDRLKILAHTDNDVILYLIYNIEELKYESFKCDDLESNIWRYSFLDLIEFKLSEVISDFEYHYERII